MNTHQDKSNQPAFPSHEGEGITTREYFAAMAMQGYIMKNPSEEPYEKWAIAKSSVEMADCMIKLLNIKNKQQ